MSKKNLKVVLSQRSKYTHLDKSQTLTKKFLFKGTVKKIKICKSIIIESLKISKIFGKALDIC